MILSTLRPSPELDPAVEAVMAGYPEPVRQQVLHVRSLVFQVADERDEIGPLTETLKWGQASYLTEATKSGTTLRLAPVKNRTKHFGLYVHCRTRIIEHFRDVFSVEAAQGIIEFEQNRGLILDCKKPLPIDALSMFISHALTYHLQK